MKTITIFVLAAVMVTAITTISISLSSPAALAQKSQGSNGLETADQNVHDTPGGFTGQQDLNFHVGTCQGGHSTAALDQAVGGCSALPSPSELGSGHNGK